MFIIVHNKSIVGEETALKTKNVRNFVTLIVLLIIVVLFVPACDIEYYVDEPSNPDIPGNLDVYFIDVGQGDSIFIRTPNDNTILIDGGEADQGENVLNFLKELGVDKIDVIVATHLHSDHIGGLITVIENIDIGSIYMPKTTHNTKTFEKFVLSVKQKGLQFKPAYAGVDIPLDDVDANFVGPEKKDTYDDLNNSSAVLKLKYGDVSFIFTGDAEKESEEYMLSSGQNLRAQVLKVGHHGSTTSTSEEFLKAISPEYAIISCGEGNKYGHPHKEIIQLLEEFGIEIYRTDRDGTIHVMSDGKQIEFK